VNCKNVLLLVLSVILGTQAQAGHLIEGYTDKHSFVPGDTITFHVSTTSPTYQIDIIWRWVPSTAGDVIATYSGLHGGYHAVPSPGEQPWRVGAGWPASYSLVIPQSWETGSYFVKFIAVDGTYRYHPFCVRRAIPGSRSRLAAVLNYNTRNAYNFWGGKSLYTSFVPGDTSHAVAVSFRRPYSRGYGRGRFYDLQEAVFRQLEADGFAPEYITEWDIHSNPGLLNAYEVLVFTHHHEYISRRVYDACVRHHNRGAHLAFFSANDIWWQIHYEYGGDTMVCYRNFAARDDPMFGVHDCLVTTHWHSELLDRPGAALQGISVEYGESCPSWAFQAADYLVQSSSHWAFKGTGLEDGDPFGELMASTETDSIQASSPPILDVLLAARRDEVRPSFACPEDAFSDAVAVYYEDSPAYGFSDGNGGQVFAGGARDGWSNALLGSPPDAQLVGLVIRNIIQHMLDSPPAVSPGDSDADGDLDLLDFSEFRRCLTGERAAPCDPPLYTDSVCRTFDLDGDGDVDLIDFWGFQNAFSGSP